MARIIERHTGKDGVERVKVALDLTEQQVRFDRTGLTPTKTMWVPAEDYEHHVRIAVHGYPRG